MPSKMITVVLQFIFLAINMLRVLLRAHFSPCLMAGAEMNLSWAQNIFMPMNMYSIVLLILSDDWASIP